MDSLLTKRIWLLALIFLTLAMIGVGGVTRLTRSGLSITEWRPITGIVPPMSEGQWQEEFYKYQETKEYKFLHSHFAIEDFKSIFLLEYGHRLLGRIVFLFAFIFGFYLCRKRTLEWSTFSLVTGWIAFQGLVGWLMVRSGLGQEVNINPLMLSAHFFMALGLMFFLVKALTMTKSPLEIRPSRKIRVLVQIIGMVILLQLFFGTLTSAHRAGFVSSTFPLMQGELMPKFLWQLQPFYKNFIENPFTIQWVHRWLGVACFAFVLLFGHLLKRELSFEQRKSMHWFLAIVLAQVVLGIMLLTLRVPILVASMHQLLGAIVFMIFLFTYFKISSFSK